GGRRAASLAQPQPGGRSVLCAERRGWHRWIRVDGAEVGAGSRGRGAASREQSGGTNSRVPCTDVRRAPANQSRHSLQGIRTAIARPAAHHLTAVANTVLPKPTPGGFREEAGTTRLFSRKGAKPHMKKRDSSLRAGTHVTPISFLSFFALGDF